MGYIDHQRHNDADRSLSPSLNHRLDLIRSRNPKLGATPESHRVVIHHRRHDESPVQDSGHQDRIFKLQELVAEAAVGRVPEERGSRERGAFWGVGFEEGRGAEGEVEEEEEEGEEEG